MRLLRAQRAGLSMRSTGWTGSLLLLFGHDLRVEGRIQKLLLAVALHALDLWAVHLDQILVEAKVHLLDDRHRLLAGQRAALHLKLERSLRIDRLVERLEVVHLVDVILRHDALLLQPGLQVDLFEQTHRVAEVLVDRVQLLVRSQAGAHTDPFFVPKCFVGLRREYALHMFLFERERERMMRIISIF